jgi:hypothetical protein
MSNVEKAKKLLETTNREFTDLMNNIFIEDAPLEELNKLYNTTAELNVMTSQLIDKEGVIEGVIEVDNRRSKVVIGGIDFRGNMEFEMQFNGRWYKGFRSNSNYGQVFNGTDVETNESIVQIIESGTNKGRVNLPLTTKM